MKEIINYQVITERNLEKLQIAVKAYLSEGWEPIGGICVTHSYGYTTDFYQAMVQYRAAK